MDFRFTLLSGKQVEIALSDTRHKQTGGFHVMVAVIDNQTDKAARSGILALQLNRSRPMKVQFREIQLSVLQTDNIVHLKHSIVIL